MIALVVDDEAPARRRLSRLLAGLGIASLEAADGHEALAVLAHSSADLVLLDVCMPGLDGLGLASRHGSLPPVVFVTAHAEFAVRAFELEAVDYLVKPVRLERLSAALERVARRSATEAARSSADGVQPRAVRASPTIAVSERGLLRIFSAHEIACFRASDKYTLFRADGVEHAIVESLSALETRLAGHGFARVHRSELVNLARVRSLRCSDGAGELTLSDGQRVAVSRRALPALREQLRTYPGSKAC